MFCRKNVSINAWSISTIVIATGVSAILGAAVSVAGSFKDTWKPLQSGALNKTSLETAYLSTIPPEQRICTDVSAPSSSETANYRSENTSQLIRGNPLASLTSTLKVYRPRQFNLEPWPGIHSQARVARVPILMYHDILTEPEVFFDLTPADLETHLQQLQKSGFTPVSLDQLVQHLRTGKSLAKKPVVLTFDDGYAGHYEHVYPILKRFNAPAVFSIFPGKLNGDVVGRSTLSWEQLKEVAADPLVTIAAHSITHPNDLRQLSDEQLTFEVHESKRILEERLDITIDYFTYPAGHYDERVMASVEEAGFLAALTMRNFDEKLASESDSLLAIERMGQSNLPQVLDIAWGGPHTETVPEQRFNFITPVTLKEIDLEGVPLLMAIGGRPVTVHADSRYQVSEILARTNAIAAVDGGFFSLEYLDSNIMIGPVLSQSTRKFMPGNASENPLLNGRPLVLINSSSVEFLPFDDQIHNTLTGIQQEMPNVTDAFVAAAWLVKDGQPQSENSFGTLFDYDALRHRAYWGINYAGQPVVGVTKDRIDSVTLGALLAQMGLRDAVMVDSGASTSLAYENEALMHYQPRPVPHVVALIEPHQANGNCPLVLKDEL